jgi:DNA-binding transcriptional LysR family regulator
VGARSDGDDLQLGVWQGLAERPDVRYVVRDWQAKLQFVAAGLAITTLAPVALGALPDGVHVVAVRGEPCETRRMVLARTPGAVGVGVRAVADELRRQALPGVGGPGRA